jgi:hypothetical protein
VTWRRYAVGMTEHQSAELIDAYSDEDAEHRPLARLSPRPRSLAPEAPLAPRCVVMFTAGA